MNRTVLIVGSLVVLTISAGCLGGAVLGGSSGDDAPSYPETPSELTNESVAEYARQYERTATYREVKKLDNRVNLTCNATVEDRTDEGFYARAGCAVTTRSNGGVGSGGPGIGRAYFVNDSETVRVAPERVSDRSYAALYNGSKRSENLVSGPGLRVVNFDTERHVAKIGLTYLDGSSPESAFEEEYKVSAESGVEQSTVTLRKGTYRLRVELDDGTAASYRWSVTRETDLATAHVTRSGEIALRTPSGIRLPKS